MRLTSTILLVQILFTATVQAQDDPKTILTKAIAAHGGADNLVKQNISRARSSGTVIAQGMELPFTAETVAELPDRLKTTLTVTVQGMKLAQVQVLNGGKAWIQLFGNTTEVPGPVLNEMKETVYVSQCQTLVPLLRDAEYKLTPLAEIKVQNRPAVGFNVAALGHRDLKMYFDKETMLLVKVERRTIDVTARRAIDGVEQQPKEILRETFLSDYKEIDGVKTPTKVVLLNDGQPYVNSIVSETQYLEKVDPKIFSRP